MIVIKPLSTCIEQIIKIEDILIIRENYFEFKGLSNVCCVQNDGIKWFAELPGIEDFYSSDIRIVNNKIEGYS